eukprot:6624327-Pyramimonas_sp.AAC.1
MSYFGSYVGGRFPGGSGRVNSRALRRISVRIGPWAMLCRALARDTLCCSYYGRKTISLSPWFPFGRACACCVQCGGMRALHCGG